MSEDCEKCGGVKRPVPQRWGIGPAFANLPVKFMCSCPKEPSDLDKLAEHVGAQIHKTCEEKIKQQQDDIADLNKIIERLEKERDELKADRDKYKHYWECADTPLMRDVLKERDEALKNVENWKAHWRREKSDRELISRQMDEMRNAAEPHWTEYAKVAKEREEARAEVERLTKDVEQARAQDNDDWKRVKKAEAACAAYREALEKVAVDISVATGFEYDSSWLRAVLENNLGAPLLARLEKAEAVCEALGDWQTRQRCIGEPRKAFVAWDAAFVAWGAWQAAKEGK